MKNIDNKQLRKLIRGKRFKTTVRNWNTKSTTYEYRITNIKLNYGNDDPTTSDQTWKTTVVNIVCSGTTTQLVTKKRPAKGWGDMSDEDRIKFREKRLDTASKGKQAPLLIDCPWLYSKIQNKK